MATKNHPDTGGNPEEFKLILRAYETLSDPDKRAHYDRTGTDSQGSQTLSPPESIAIGFLDQAMADKYTRGDIFKDARHNILEKSKAIKKQVSEYVAKLQDCKKKLDKIEKDNLKTKNKAGLKTVVQWMHSGIAATEKVIEREEQNAIWHEEAIEVLEGLKYNAEPAPYKKSASMMDSYVQMYSGGRSAYGAAFDYWKNHDEPKEQD